MLLLGAYVDSSGFGSYSAITSWNLYCRLSGRISPCARELPSGSPCNCKKSRENSSGIKAVHCTAGPQLPAYYCSGFVKVRLQSPAHMFIF